MLDKCETSIWFVTGILKICRKEKQERNFPHSTSGSYQCVSCNRKNGGIK